MSQIRLGRQVSFDTVPYVDSIDRSASEARVVQEGVLERKISLV
jgi:hypothetical protein